MTINWLFIKKLFLAFVLGFAYVAVQKITNVGAYAAFSTWHVIWKSLISGAVTGGFRAILVLLPINLVPSDAGGLTGASEAPPAVPAAPAAK